MSRRTTLVPPLHGLSFRRAWKGPAIPRVDLFSAGVGKPWAISLYISLFLPKTLDNARSKVYKRLAILLNLALGGMAPLR